MNKVSYKTLEKVVENGYYIDTPKYRYILETVNGEYAQYDKISRLLKSELNTTEAINGWESVALVVDGNILRL